ncbi:chemotaxis protein CheC [Peribacillus sp. FSL H8-0477]|uniref:chemotaxis protein CheC n=1 Tax=Peribacillus sp. FSL H8-0477 TaxID=2921388 RepID=UPI0030F90D55
MSTFQLSVLQEIGNIGSGNAATALSTLLQRKIDMKVPSVRVLSFEEMMEAAGGSEMVAASVFLRLEGEAPGSMFFILPLKQAEFFIHEVTDEVNFSFTNPPYSEIALSALQEVGNILSGSYLSALSDFTGLTLLPSVPSLSIDMVGATISYGLIELSQTGDLAILIDTVLTESGTNEAIQGHFFLLPDPDSLDIMFTSLGVSGNE